MKVSVIVFPGTNCDHDIIHAYRKLLGVEVSEVWHRDSDLGTPDVVVVPGGFSYGDYLRTGALAKLSPVMQSVRDFADGGGSIIGICNGFQILCEAELLPGALLQNVECKFLSRFVTLRVEHADTPFTSQFSPGDTFPCPIAHFDGNYFAPPDLIERLEGEGQVVFRYCDAAGNISPGSEETNPNGSINSIAGICNAERNVVGMMPHPERAAETIVGYLGGSTGLRVFG